MRVLDLFAGTGSSTWAFRDAGHEVVHVELYPKETGTPEPFVKADVVVLAQDPRRYLGDWVPDQLHASPVCAGFCVPAIGRMWEKDAGGKGIHHPKHPTAEAGLAMLDASVALIDYYTEQNPRLSWTLENPTAMMRKVMPGRHPHIARHLHPVHYCQYGPLGPVPVMHGPELVLPQKATDIWTNLQGFDARRCCAGSDNGVRNHDGDWFKVYATGAGKERRFTLRLEDRGPMIQVPKKQPMMINDEPQTFYTCTPDGKACHEWAARGWKAGIQRIKGSGARAGLPRALSRAFLEAAIRHHNPPPTVQRRSTLADWGA